MNLDGRAKAGLGVLGALAIVGGWGAWSLRQTGANAAPLTPIPAASASPAAPVEIQAGGQDAPAAPTPTPAAPATIKVHVAGAVKKPGVYILKPNDRIEDAIRAAGGFAADADREALNLADFARDADQYNIPKKVSAPAGGKVPVAPPAPARPAVVRAPAPTSKPGEMAATPAAGRVLGKPLAPTPPAETTAGTATDAPEAGGKTAPRSGSAKFKNPGDGAVNLNTATLEELQKLPGVGPSTAEKIIAYRQQIGRFNDISQIQDVKGIGPKKFEKMKPFLTVH